MGHRGKEAGGAVPHTHTRKDARGTNNKAYNTRASSLSLSRLCLSCSRMHRMSETTARLELVLPSGPAAAAAAAATALEVVAELIAVMADWPVPAGAVATLKSKRAEYMKGLEKAAAEEKRRAAEEAKKKEEAEARKKMTPAEREKADKAAKEKEAKKAGAGGPRVKMVTR